MLPVGHGVQTATGAARAAPSAAGNETAARVAFPVISGSVRELDAYNVGAFGKLAEHLPNILRDCHDAIRLRGEHTNDLIRWRSYLADGHPVAVSWFGIDPVDLVEERPDIEDREIGGVADPCFPDVSGIGRR